jgi:DNA-binding NarL/FixJ family response regulator
MGQSALVIVEDDATLRAELVALFSAQADFRVVAEFGDATSAVASMIAFDLAIVDIGLPDGSGVDVIRVLAARWPDAELMAHTIDEDSRTVYDAIVAGASGYVLKGGSRDELLAATRLLRDDGSPMSPRIARTVVEAFRKQGTVAAQYALSARERDVLLAMEEGLSYKETAARLHLSYHTVHTHLKRIYEKLQVGTKQDAMTKARLRGWL